MLPTSSVARVIRGTLCYLDGEGVERDGAAAALAVLRVHRQHVGPPRPQPAHVERGRLGVLQQH